MAFHTLNAKDTIAGNRGECYVIIDGRRINFMSAISVEATVEKTKVEVPILGQKMKGNKTINLKGTGTATFHYNTSVFRQAMKHFKDTGEDLYFDMIIINDDPGSNAGRQSTTLKGCNLNKVIVAKVDANDEKYLEETIDFTFEDWDIPEEFQELEGMWFC